MTDESGYSYGVTIIGAGPGDYSRCFIRNLLEAYPLKIHENPRSRFPRRKIEMVAA